MKTKSQVIKLKKKIEELEGKVYDKERDVEYYRGKYDQAKNDFEKLEEQQREWSRKIEGMNMPALEEREWLRDLVMLITVDGGKIPELAKYMKYMDEQREKKMRRY